MIDHLFAIVMTLLRLVLTGIVIVKITRFRDTMNAMERIGLGLMGSGSFLTVGVIWERSGSPFEGWAATLLTLGAVLFLIGRTRRDWIHSQANQAGVRAAAVHLKSRGKL